MRRARLDAGDRWAVDRSDQAFRDQKREVRDEAGVTESEDSEEGMVSCARVKRRERREGGTGRRTADAHVRAAFQTDALRPLLILETDPAAETLGSECGT